MTIYVTHAKSVMASLLSIWNTLSTDDKLTWENGARDSNFISMVGRPINFSGYGLFRSCNTVRQRAGLSTYSTYPGFSTAQIPNNLYLTCATGVPNALDLSIIYFAPATANFMVYMRSCYLPGDVTQGNALKFLGVIAIDPESYIISLIDLYTAVFGNNVVNNRIFDVLLVRYDEGTGLCMFGQSTTCLSS